MKTIHCRKLHVAFFIFVFISLVDSFHPEEKRNAKADVVLSSSEIKHFTYLAKRSGWHSYLGIIGNITVFSPEDAAFEELSVRTRRMITQNMHRLYELVANHMHFHLNYYAKDFYDGQYIQMGFGEFALVNIRKNSIGETDAAWVNGKRVIRRLDTQNGIIYTLNGLITSPTLQLIEFMQHYYSHFGGFEQLLQKARLLYPPRFTIFLPINACFKKMPKNAFKFLFTDRIQLTGLVKYHIIPDLRYIDPLPEGVTAFTTTSGKTLIVQRDGARFVLRVPGTNITANIVTPDLRVKSAVIHVIDAILEPYEDLLAMEKLQEYKIFSIFARKLKASGFSKLLGDNDKKFTIFAPRDDAWRALSDNVKAKLQTNQTYLNEVLKNHIREGLLKIGAMKDYTQITTLNGEKMMLRKYGDENSKKMMINEAVVDEHDRMAANGIIHIVDRVLLPKPKSLWNEIEENQNNAYQISMFRAALKRTGLWKLVQQDSYYKKMIWAPTDEAFRKLPTKQIQYLMDDKNAMRDVLKYHITPGYFHTSLMDERWIYVFKTLHKRKKVRCRKKLNRLIVFNPKGPNAKSVEIDIVARNGLMNIVDEVLIPKDYGFLKKL